MTIKNDLSNLKVGDKVFSTSLGEVEIKEIDYIERNYPVNASHTWHTICGRTSKDHKYPSLFLSAKHALEYFASIKEKKPIHIKYYVHDYLNKDGVHFTLTSKHSNSSVCSDEIYLGCTEINKTYEIEE